jgi:argininosuccinate lyase
MKKPRPSPSTVVSRSGRFTDGPSQEIAQFSQSVSFDWRLWSHDLVGSMAHATMLEKIGILSSKECKDIIAGLKAIGMEIEAGRFQWKTELEDVHMNIEAALTARVPAAAKLHTARSRNDQVALDVRLWLRDEIEALLGELRTLQRSLVKLGERHSEVIIPGYTHMQRAQPVFFAHHCLAYVEMFDRDTGRLADAFGRLNVCPLGAGAIAGSTLPLDREFVATLLGFTDTKGRPRITQNSMDAVSDRDFLIEFSAAAALIAVHLSRLSEDLILWASSEFSFIRIADAYTTGSSLMPQKKNPDLAELTRGKSGRVIGNLVSLLVLLKGLPMTYSKDMQEDKEPVIQTMETISLALAATTGMVDDMTVNADAMLAARKQP